MPFLRSLTSAETMLGGQIWARTVSDPGTTEATACFDDWPGGGLGFHAHYALANLEAKGKCQTLLTQNVDRLHRAAGSRAVIDLHGRLDLVRCTACSATNRRANFQDELVRLSAAWVDLDTLALPDGDADLDHLDFSGFAVPACGSCGGIQKPDVVFFGENVPRDEVP